MSIISSICLAVFFARDEGELFADLDWSVGQRFYYVLTNELPFLLVFLSHWIIYFQYL